MKTMAKFLLVVAALSWFLGYTHIGGKPVEAAKVLAGLSAIAFVLVRFFGWAAATRRGRKSCSVS